MDVPERYPWGWQQLARFNAVIGRQLMPQMELFDPEALLLRAEEHPIEFEIALRRAMKEFQAGFGSPFRKDRTREGWKLVKPTGPDMSEWEDDPTATGPVPVAISDCINLAPWFELVDFIPEGEKRYVSGALMRWRALEVYGCDSGQFLAEMLLGLRRSIPDDWRPYKFAFPGTVWCDEFNRLYFPCLEWDNVSPIDGVTIYDWHVWFRAAENDWYSYFRLLRCLMTV